MCRPARLAAISSALVTVVCAAAGQQSAQNPSPAPETTFKATTRVVNVNVVVTDPHGNPITGLTKDDFELLDDGKPQQIRFFDAIKNEASLLPAVTLRPDTFTNLQPEQGVPPSVTAILFDTRDTDWVAEAYALHHLRAFLRKLHPQDRIALYVRDEHIELLHDYTQDSSDLIAAIARYDAQRTGPKGQRLKLQPGDLSELDHFLAGDDIKTWLQRRAEIRKGGPDQRAPGSLGQAMAAASEPRVTQTNATARVVSLPDIARHLAKARGRKSLVWIAQRIPELLPDEHGLQQQLLRTVATQAVPAQRNHGFKAVMVGPYGMADPKDRARRDIRNGLYTGDLVPLLVRLFNDNDIAVYPIAAEGLETLSLGLGKTSSGFDIEDDPEFLLQGNDPQFDVYAALNMLDQIPNQSWVIHSQMDDLARRSGGRAYINRNALEIGIQQALDDARYNYELAYYPDHNDWRGEWRRLQVKLKNPERFVKPPSGVAQEMKNLLVGGFSAHLQARSGYFALPEPKPPASQDRRELVTTTINNPTEAVELPFTVKIVPMPAGNPPGIEAVVSMDAHGLLTADDQGHGKGNFELLFAQLGSDELVTSPDAVHKCCTLRRPLEVPLKSYNLALNAGDYEKAMQQGLGATERLTLRPGATVLAVVLHNKNTNAVGSVRIPLAQYFARLEAPASQH